MSLNPKLNKQEDDEEEVDDNYDPEKEVVGAWQPVNKLPEVPVVTGQQQEQTITIFRSKLYRWFSSKDSKQWKERGVGELKFLKHKKTGFVRLLLRAEKTHKCVLNHYIQKKQIFCQLEQMKTSNNAWTWAAYDISDQKPASEKFCAKFTSKEQFDRFKTEFEKSAEENAKLFASKEEKKEQKEEEKKQ